MSRSPRAERGVTPPAAPHLNLDLQIAPEVDAVHRTLLSRPRVRRWLARALQRDAELTVRVVGSREARALNAQFRGRDYATNVLTFDYAQTPVVMADLVLCAPVVQREAKQQGKALLNHYAHLIVHGALHAQGYDHEQDESAALEMEALEVLLLGSLGLPNPY